MKHCFPGFLATTAAFAVFGGLHFEIASSTVLDRLSPDDARISISASTTAAGINRAAKSARWEIAESSVESRTITFQHPGLPSTTVALRLWETASAVKIRSTLKGRNVPARNVRHTVACEGVVSTLTDIAKHLQAGRCVT